MATKDSESAVGRLEDEGTATAPAPAASPAAPGSSGAALLDVRDLHTTFDTPMGAVRAVDGVSFTVEQGKTLAIVGESGCGKTITSRTIMNLLPREGVTTSGEVLFEGRNLLQLDDRELRSLRGTSIAMIFQDPMTSLHPVMKVGKQITEVLRLHLHLSRPEARDRAVELLKAVHIPEPERRLREYPHQLSGGMRQRVMIAIAIACEPKLLIADEPTTALDVTVQAQILDLLQELQTERQMGLILVSHDLGVVATRADEIAVMYAGKIVERAPTRPLFHDTRMPYTLALLESIPRLNEDGARRLHAIAGRPPDLRNIAPGCRFAPRCAYVQDRCRIEEPPLAPIAGTTHSFACWFPPSGGTSAPDAPAENAYARSGANGQGAQ